MSEIDDVIKYVQIETTRITLEAIIQAIEPGAPNAVRKEMGIWARNARRKTSRREGIRKVNDETAKGAVRAISNAYEAKRDGAGPYRNKDRGRFRRYSGGRLGKALSSPKLVVGDGDGIHFVDTEMLDKAAKQWYRLNFGAVPGKPRKPNNKGMTFRGTQTDIKMSLATYPQSKRFTIPKGFWSAERAPLTIGAHLTAPGSRSGSRDAFYAVSKRRKPASVAPGMVPTYGRSPTKGIDAERFLDKGAAYINNVYPKRVSNLMESWLRK